MTVKVYSYKKDKNKKLSTNFKVAEWQCKDGSDIIKIDPNITDYLEKILSHFELKSGNIYSGYRTASYDKKIGGKGSGSHVLGYAVDIKFKYKNGKYIPSKYICCYAQDIGLKGIAKNSTYGVHLDTRPRVWRADETNRNIKVSDFYNYFNVTKEEIYPTSKKEIINETPESIIKDESTQTIEPVIVETSIDTIKKNIFIIIFDFVKMILKKIKK